MEKLGLSKRKYKINKYQEILKEKGYFYDVDKNELIKDILANCEVIK